MKVLFLLICMIAEILEPESTTEFVCFIPYFMNEEAMW